MTKLCENLLNGIKTQLKDAEELWIAVALLNESGLNSIIQNIPKNCKTNFIVGINLPTSPKALTMLLEKKIQNNSMANVLTSQFFHPKVYIINSHSKLSAFVGRYKPLYDRRMVRKKEEKKELEKLINEEDEKQKANLEQSSKLIKKLKRFRVSKDYEQVKQGRQKTIDELRSDLDYPHFTSINYDTFFSQSGFLRPSLGTLPALQIKGSILKNKEKFVRLLKLICNESIPLNERLERAMSKAEGIDNVKEAFISKVLTVHNSEQYYVHNRLFSESLKPFGLTLIRGLKFHEKYVLIRDILKKEILEPTKIENFAILDLVMIEEYL